MSSGVPRGRGVRGRGFDRGVDENLLGIGLLPGPYGPGHRLVRSRRCRVGRHHEQHEVVLIAAGDEHRVVADGIPVDVHDAAVDDRAARDVVPGVRVQADAGDRPQSARSGH